MSRMRKAELAKHLESDGHVRRGRRMTIELHRWALDYMEDFHRRLHEEQEVAFHRGPQEHKA